MKRFIVSSESTWHELNDAFELSYAIPNDDQTLVMYDVEGDGVVTDELFEALANYPDARAYTVEEWVGVRDDLGFSFLHKAQEDE